MIKLIDLLPVLKGDFVISDCKDGEWMDIDDQSPVRELMVNLERKVEKIFVVNNRLCIALV